jgi:hypothetical protein
LWDVEDPILCRQSAHKWRLGCQIYVPAAFYPQEDLVLFSVRGWVNSMVRLEGLSKLKKLIDLVGTRIRDFATCSID